jgi:hypothetical protein
MLEVKQHVKQIYETRDETYDETSGETCKRKMKSVPKPTGYIHGMWQIVTVMLEHELKVGFEFVKVSFRVVVVH